MGKYQRNGPSKRQTCVLLLSSLSYTPVDGICPHSKTFLRLESSCNIKSTNFVLNSDASASLTTHEKHRKEKQNGARRFVLRAEKVVMDKRGLYRLQQLLQNLTQFKNCEELPLPCQCCLKKMRFKPRNNKAAVGTGTKIAICRQLHRKFEELQTFSKCSFVGKGWRENQSQNSPHYITRTDPSSKIVAKGAESESLIELRAEHPNLSPVTSQIARSCGSQMYLAFNVLTDLRSELNAVQEETTCYPSNRARE
ncbi:hypothetical protein Anapl_14025 [Anas platyrhynchos]|uniref:Uncharacterized protein n=1 Tax=Anas platyrhynchos TaxID=8839 RepID=R0LN75_ANAPL|nr:hypothetical protein Anapl_14025 [Anas platyrhynchos]